MVRERFANISSLISGPVVEFEEEENEVDEYLRSSGDELKSENKISQEKIELSYEKGKQDNEENTNPETSSQGGRNYHREFFCSSKLLILGV